MHIIYIFICTPHKKKKIIIINTVIRGSSHSLQGEKWWCHRFCVTVNQLISRSVQQHFLKVNKIPNKPYYITMAII